MRHADRRRRQRRRGADANNADAEAVDAANADADAAATKGPGGDGGARVALVRLGEALSLGFPVWVASACALALWRPPAFLWVGPTAQMLGISFTMLGPSLLPFLPSASTSTFPVPVHLVVRTCVAC